MLEPKIVIISEMKMVGNRLTMSLTDNKTSILWKNFMIKRKEIFHNENSDLYSIQIYNPDLDFNDFTPSTSFEKWAAVEVEEIDRIPDKMETLTIPKGEYAVFKYRGLPSNFQKMAEYIFGVWLPNSQYQLDNRPHFEIMKADYNPNDPSAEETVWIPIR